MMRKVPYLIDKTEYILLNSAQGPSDALYKKSFVISYLEKNFLLKTDFSISRYSYSRSRSTSRGRYGRRRRTPSQVRSPSYNRSRRPKKRTPTPASSRSRSR